MASISNSSSSSTPFLPFGEPITERRAPRKPNVAHAPTATEAREAAFDKIKSKRAKRCSLILHALSRHGPMTAREILRLLITQGHLPPTAERNQVSPRISEMADAGCVAALDELRRVGSDAPASVWRITPRGLDLLALWRREAAPRGEDT